MSDESEGAYVTEAMMLTDEGILRARGLGAIADDLARARKALYHSSGSPPGSLTDPAYLRALEDAAANLERHADEEVTPGEYLRDEDTRASLRMFASGLRCLYTESAQRVLREYRGSRKGDGLMPINLAAVTDPSLIIVTRVLGDGDGDGNDVVLGPSDWRAIRRPDGSTTVVVPPELEARARELWPGVTVEKGGGR